jgi:short-subunit dehydrogenase
MNKTVLITGASKGIGKATAQFFEEKGWNVAATMRTPEKVTDLKESKFLKKLKLDVQDKESIFKALNQSLDYFGKIDVVVNNAGYGAFGLIEAAKDEHVKRAFDVNLFGMLNVTKSVLPHFRENGKGIIVNVSSMAGVITLPLSSLYVGTKFAMEGMSETLNYELNPYGIKVRLVEPGMVRTDFFSEQSMDFFQDSTLTDYDALIAKINNAMDHLLKMKMGKSRNVAKVIYKAATDGNGRIRYVSGVDAKLLMFTKKWFGTNACMKLVKKTYKF